MSRHSNIKWIVLGGFIVSVFLLALSGHMQESAIQDAERVAAGGEPSTLADNIYYALRIFLIEDIYGPAPKARQTRYMNTEVINVYPYRVVEL